MSFSVANPIFHKARQVRGITGVPRGSVHTYEPFFVNPRHWANFIIGPKESGKFTLVCHWLDEWRRNNRLDRLVLVSASTTCSRSEGPLGALRVNVNLNSPNWLDELDSLVALKKETAPLETWAVVLDQCFWQPWVLKHRLMRRLVTGGRQERVALFCLFERPPNRLDDFIRDNLDSVVALPYETLEGWQADLVHLTGGRFVPALWKEGKHPKHTLWAVSLTRSESVPHTIRPLPGARVVNFQQVKCLLGTTIEKKPYATASQAKSNSAIRSSGVKDRTKEPSDLSDSENKVGDVEKDVREGEEVPPATWWEAVSSWFPPLPSIGLFSAWSE